MPPPFGLPSLQGVVQALNDLGKIASQIAQNIAAGLINLGNNNIFQGTNTFNGVVTFNALANILAGLRLGTRVVTAAGAVAVTNADAIVVVNKTVGAATTVNLPAGVANQIFIIKDGKGDAAANNITITPAAGNIDGAGTLVISANFGRAWLVYNGTQWNQIG